MHKTLLSLCQTNKRADEICKDENFWKKRTYKNFENINKRHDMTWRKYYLYRLSHEIISVEIEKGLRVTIEIDKNSEYGKKTLREYNAYRERFNWRATFTSYINDQIDFYLKKLYLR